MSNLQNEIYIENLIEEYNRLKNIWNGSDLKLEERINDIEAQLEELGVNV